MAKLAREQNAALSVDNGYLAKVPFDLAYWQQVAAEKYPDGLPEPYSNDPTQWLFKGTVTDTTQPLQVALARLWLRLARPGGGRDRGRRRRDCAALGPARRAGGA